MKLQCLSKKLFLLSKDIKFLIALVLNLLKDFFERSKIFFDRLRTSAGINKIVMLIIVGLRPLFGQAHCKYAVSCTKFAQWQLQEKALLPALWSIFKRVCSCNPFT